MSVGGCEKIEPILAVIVNWLDSEKMADLRLRKMGLHVLLIRDEVENGKNRGSLIEPKI